MARAPISKCRGATTTRAPAGTGPAPPPNTGRPACAPTSLAQTGSGQLAGILVIVYLTAYVKLVRHRTRTSVKNTWSRQRIVAPRAYQCRSSWSVSSGRATILMLSSWPAGANTKLHVHRLCPARLAHAHSEPEDEYIHRDAPEQQVSGAPRLGG